MPSIGKTADGVEIVQGLRVFTNDLDAGYIDLNRGVTWEENQNPSHPNFGTKTPWFYVVLDKDPSGRGKEMTPDRVGTVHPSTRKRA
jgi:hypothetical protein